MIDALTFAKTRKRICRHYQDYTKHGGCTKCPLGAYECHLGYSASDIETDENLIKLVEKWGKEHPAKIRIDKFLEIFPNADKEQIITICPGFVDNTYRCNSTSKHECNRCTEKYWNEEVE